MNRYEQQQYMLQELLDLDEGMTNKEMDFLDSLCEWEGDFTDNQFAWLESIWNRLLGDKVTHD